MAKPQYNTAQHKALRKAYRRDIDAGHGVCAEPICLMPSRHIGKGMAFDLAHNRATGGYHGPSHPTCNRAEGARYMHAKGLKPKPSTTWRL